MKNRELLDSAESLAALASTKLKGSIGFIVAHNFKQVQEHLKTLDTSRLDIVKANTKLDEEGKPIPVKDADGRVQENQVHLKDRDAFTKELGDLFDLEVGDLIKIKKLKASSLDLVEIEPRHLALLGWMIED